MRCPARSFLLLILALLATVERVSSSVIINPSRTTPAFVGPALDRLKRDFLALTRRMTARHILLPKNSDAALLLKQKIRNRVLNSDENEGQGFVFIVDAFEAAARKYSLDQTTREQGGLLGELVPQGYCVCAELDKACFQVPLGEVEGPIESDYGYHLLLVSERTNCPKLDGEFNKLIKGEDGRGILVHSTESQNESGGMLNLLLNQVGFWVLTFLAGGIVAELAAKAGGVIETLPWENQISGLL